MPDGEPIGGGLESQMSALTVTENNCESSTSSSIGDDELGLEVLKLDKDPRRIARKYQLDLCKKALEENIIVYLGTGYGKTHIAVLLIYELGHLIKKPQKSVCVFLAPTVPLVEQQARVIESSIDFKVGIYCGNSKHLKSHHDWEKEMEKYEVLVMTPQVLLRNLNHCFIKMELIALLIFDECHHAQIQSNHPYAEIMRVFHKTNASNLPRIFGMTASPVVGKGASNEADLPKCINSLENLLVAKVYSVEENDELAKFVASPAFKVYHYGPVANTTSSFHMVYSGKLDEIKRQCLLILSQKTTDDHKSLRLIKRSLQRVHENLIFCLEHLGICGALQASRSLLSGDCRERNELIEAGGVFGDSSLCDRYLTETAAIFSSDCVRDGIESDISCVDALKEPFFSKKLLCLIGILSTFRARPNMKCIIFVDRVITARCLSYLLQNLKFLTTWKCDFLVGVHSGLKFMSRKTTNNILKKFHSGELNLLIATKVGEEGLDIQTCCLVIRFDLPQTVSSFIQSRGRARMPMSEYAFLVNSANKKEQDLIDSFKISEGRMNKEIACRSSSESFDVFEENVYQVDSGASISAGYSTSLLHHYCSKLPRDEYFVPKMEFFYFDDSEGTVCNIVFPSNAPIRQVASRPQCSKEAAKKDACLQACKELHELGALNEYLLPSLKIANKEFFPASTNSDICKEMEDEGSRSELHEMLVPASLKNSWNNSENHVHLSSYYLKFTPIPVDRTYKRFGLFLMVPLPEEAEGMQVDLHLAHGRSVMTELVPTGVVKFDKGEILQAQKFQEMFFKVILERSELVHDFVSLGMNDIHQSNSTFYLLLPIIHHDFEDILAVDWNVIRKSLSSPIFRTTEAALDDKFFNLDNHLQLADGPRSIDDILDSLVYVPYKNAFCIVSEILYEKDANCSIKELTSHVEHLSQKFGIHLSHPGQPLLKSKQLFSLHNLLHNRKNENSESVELEEHFFEIPPELCQLKIIAFSKDMGSSISLLPSVMHRLENFLVAIELKCMLSASFPEGSKVTANHVLEALTTEKCIERFSLERLEVLGDAFLKFAVGRHLFLSNHALDEGQLTTKRSNEVNNSNLYMLATLKGLQVYIRDQPFDRSQFYALGHPCPVICHKETERIIHSQCENMTDSCSNVNDVRCNKCHHWLQKKTISDVVEALIGAFLVDSGFKAATAFLRWIGIEIDFKASQVTNICLASASCLPLSSSTNVPTVESSLKYKFLHKGLLLQALVHPSYSKHRGGCYQRLEFLGDAVMDYLITSYLYSVYPVLKPGQFTDLRSVFVNNKTFANIAVCKSLHNFLISDSSALSEAIDKYVVFIKTAVQQKSSVEGPKCPKALGDLMESCIGAILLDTGFNLNHLWSIMLSFLDSVMKYPTWQPSPTRELRELCQGYNWDLEFSTSEKDHFFLAQARVSGVDICAIASATHVNKKEATKIAAQKLCQKIKGEGFVSKSKTLEEELKSFCKMEAKLIGYDETPVDLTSLVDRENLQMLEPSSSHAATYAMNEELADANTPCIRRVSSNASPTFKSIGGQRNESIRDNCCSTDSHIPGDSHKSAKSRLHEVCAANYWKPPDFECCEEDGPSHLKLFTFKVVVTIEEAFETILESYGEPALTKRAAAEHAAEGLLWYLTKKGYLTKNV